MPKKQRERSATGVYHIMLRGVNRQRIFEWVEDYQFFIKLLYQTMHTDSLGKPTEVPNYQLHAYCLMDNHIHLLMSVTNLPLEVCIMRIAGTYAKYFNRKYERVGHFFQDRFRSEPCNDWRYLLTLFDYIHQNPVEGGICKTPDQYKFSSFNELVGQKVEWPLCTLPTDFPGVSETDIQEWVRSLQKEAKITQRNQVPLCKNEERSPEGDSRILAALFAMSGVTTVSEFQQLEKKTMRGALAKVRDTGVSIRRLSRLTGISEGIIRNCKNPANLQPSSFQPREEGDSTLKLQPTDETTVTPV